MAAVTPESDHDHHINVAPDPRYGQYLNDGDRERRGGTLLIEIMWGQDLPIPKVGDHVAVLGTWVLDTDHGWNELHPIWAVEFLATGRLFERLPPVPALYEPVSSSITTGP